MLYNAALWFVIFGKLNLLFSLLLVFSIILAVSFGIVWGYNYYQLKNGGVKEFHDTLRKASRKVFWTMIPIFLVSLTMVCVIPSTTELFLIAGMKAVDNYNVSHPNSMVSPDGVIGTADNLVKTFNEALTKITATLEKKAENAVNSIPDAQPKK